VGAVTGLVGGGGGGGGTSFATMNNNDLMNPFSSSQQATTQYQNAYTGSQAALQQQQNFLTALQGQNGIQNQSNVFGQLQGVANGTGPNPAQAMLNQSTQQNVANQAALMANQRGASANAGLIARQAAQQGAQTQQQAAGQAATMQAQQSLGAMGQLAGIAGQQVGQQANATQGLSSSQQAEQGQIQNAIAAQNNASVGINSANASMANTQMQGQQGMLGGLMNMGAGAAAALMMKDGGQVRQHFDGGGYALQSADYNNTDPVDYGSGATDMSSVGPQASQSQLSAPVTAPPPPAAPGAPSPQQSQSKAPSFSQLANQSHPSNQNPGQQNQQQPFNMGQQGNNGGSGLSQGANNLGSVLGKAIGNYFNKSSSSSNSQPGSVLTPSEQNNMQLGINPASAPLPQQTTTGPDMDNSSPAQASGSADPDQMNAARGGKVPALVSPGEVYLKPKDVKKVVNGADPMKVGEHIPGKPKVGGAKNSYANDTVKKTLDEGGIVVPRSKTKGKNPSEASIRFVHAIAAKHGMRVK
jgi:hypothetical protein